MDELTKKRSTGWATFSLHSDIGQSIAECDPTHIWTTVRVRQVLGRVTNVRFWGGKVDSLEFELSWLANDFCDVARLVRREYESVIWATQINERAYAAASI